MFASHPAVRSISLLINFCMLTNIIVWGLLMAAHRIDFHPVGSVIWLLFLWSFGETVAHSAGCVLNDILDRHVDGLVGLFYAFFTLHASPTDYC